VESEAARRLAPFLEHAIDAIVVYDDQLRIVEVNQSACRLFGRDTNELVGRTHRELFGKPARTIEPWIEKVLSSGRSTQVMHELEVNGGVVAFDACYNRIEDPVTGEPRVFGVCRDLAVTAMERKHFQDALERQQHLLEELNAIGSDSVLSLEQKALKLLRMGSEYLGLELGLIASIEDDLYTVAYAYGRGAPEAGAEYSLGETYCAHTLQSNEPVCINFAKYSPVADHPCYHRFRLEAYAGAQIVVHGRCWGTINFSSVKGREPFLSGEIEFLKLLADWIGHALTRSEDEGRLRRLLKQKSDLIRIIAHNVRNPIGSIHALAEVFMESFPEIRADQLTVTSNGLIAEMKSASEEVLRSLDEILASRLSEAEEMEILPGRHRVGELFDIIRARNAGRARRKDIRLEFTGDGAAECTFDLALLSEAVDNLVNNAIKFSSNGSTVYISFRAGRDSFSIIIEDQGPGFSEADYPLIFESSQKLSARPTGGETSHGLGLSLVKQLVEAQHGKVSVISQPGEGAKFRIKLPRNPR